MLPELEIDIERVKKDYPQKEDQENITETLQKFDNFTSIPVFPVMAEYFANYFIGHENIDSDLEIVDYKYGLTIESIEKYITNEYSDDADEYLIVGTIMSMDYEKYYKNGTFVDLDGNATYEDFYDIKNWEELKKKADFGNHWIRFTVYNLNKSSKGYKFNK